MKLFGYKLEGFAKVLVILVAIFLVASGMCGLQLLLSNNSAGGGASGFLMTMGVLELIAILLSAVAIVLLLIVWVLRAFFLSLSSEPRDRAQKLKNPDQTDKHDGQI